MASLFFSLFLCVFFCSARWRVSLRSLALQGIVLCSANSWLMPVGSVKIIIIPATRCTPLGKRAYRKKLCSDSRNFSL
jgi:hypothetical protein